MGHGRLVRRLDTQLWEVGLPVSFWGPRSKLATSTWGNWLIIGITLRPGHGDVFSCLLRAKIIHIRIQTNIHTYIYTHTIAYLIPVSTGINWCFVIILYNMKNMILAIVTQSLADGMSNGKSQNVLAKSDKIIIYACVLTLRKMFTHVFIYLEKCKISSWWKAFGYGANNTILQI